MTAAAALPVPEKVELMPRERWRFIGHDLPRLDLPAKVDGSAVFGIDVKLPGLRTAVIRQSPRFGGKLARVDAAPALAINGVEQVVPLADAVAVVARDFWSAQRGLAALQPQWNERQASTATSAIHDAALLAAVAAGGDVFVPRNGDAPKLAAAHAAAMAAAARQFEATYQVPFLHHATMEPMNATARVEAGRAELWLPTQSQSATQAAVARELGLPPEAVTIHTTLCGGGFGRRIEFDFTLQAVRIARAAGVPVKLVWSREEDMQHGYYRSAAALRLRVGLDAAGQPLALRFDAACGSLLQHSQYGANAGTAGPVDTSGLSRPPYAMGATLLAARIVEAGVPVGYWRSVAHSHNGFAFECFIDELAAMAGVDPVAYRRRLLPEASRSRRVLDALAERSGWATPPPAGRFRGIGLVPANGSVVGHVVELSLEPRQRIRLHRITTVVDCGTAVNPRNVRAQIEGGIVFALSAALWGEITLANGAVQQSNFHDYRLLTLAELPPLEVHLLLSSEAPGGVGEEAVGPLAPALANALAAAGAPRVRALPLAKLGYQLA